MAEDPNMEMFDTFSPKYKVVNVLLPYAIFLEQSGQKQMLDAISHMAKVMRPKVFVWYPMKPFITAMFRESNPPSLHWVLGLISPNVPWYDEPHDKDMVARKAAATSAALNPEEVHWSVADELLHLAFIDSLQPDIPSSWQDIPNHFLQPSDTTWDFQPRIPDGFSARPKETGGDITHKVQALGDLEILKSYLVLVWSDWRLIDGQPGGLAEMHASVREEFSGIGMGCHREDLIKQLNGVLDFYKDQESSKWAEEQCTELKRALVEVDEEAVNTLTRMPPTLIQSSLLTLIGIYRIPPDLHVHSPPPMSVISCLENLGLLPLTNHSTWTSEVVPPHSPLHPCSQADYG